MDTILSTTKIAGHAIVNRIKANTDNNCYVTYRPSISQTFIKISWTRGTGPDPPDIRRARSTSPAAPVAQTPPDVATLLSPNEPENKPVFVLSAADATMRPTPQGAARVAGWDHESPSAARQRSDLTFYASRYSLGRAAPDSM